MLPAPRGTRRPRRWWLTLTVVVAAGVVLRLVAVSPLWLDEAQTVAISQLSLPHLLSALRQDASPPLYYLLLHGWMNLFGDGMLAVRSLSGLFALAALPLFHHLGTRLSASRAAGASALVLAATNPWLVRYATETRMYSLAVLLALAALAAGGAVYRRPGPARAARLGLITGLLLLTHYWGLFLFAVAAGPLLVRYLWRRSAGTGWALLGLSAGPVLFLPWLPAFQYQMQHTATPWATAPAVGSLPSLAADWAAGSSGPATALLLVVWPIIVYGAVVGGGQAHLLAGLALGTVLLGFAVSCLTGAAMVSRYTAVVVPVVLLLLALGVTALPSAWRTGLLVFLVTAWLATDLAIAGTSRTQAAAVAGVLNLQATDRDIVLFCPDQLGPAVVRGMRVQPNLLSYPAQVWPGRLDWTDYARRIDSEDPRELARQLVRKPAADRIWFVTASGYKPFGQRCQQLGDALLSAFGPATLAVAPQRSGERAYLWRWDRS